MIVIRRIFSSCRGITKGHIARVLCITVATIAIIEFFILNIVAVYFYQVISSEISQISSSNKQLSLFNKLQNNKKINNFIMDAKADGLFVSLLQQTIERLYIVHDTVQPKDQLCDKDLHDVNGQRMKHLSFLGVDVSHSREATYIYRRIISRLDFPYHFLVVDIGANDGFLSSNSFNFIQWGWNAVLVEPQPLELHIARDNIQMYVDRYNDGDQTVKYIQSAIGSTDGTVDFVITKATQGAESHIDKLHKPVKDGDVVVQMPCITVKTLAAENMIPKNFGVLSIDVEGTGTEVLKQWITLGFRPAYIIFEQLHLHESVPVTVNYLQAHGYRYLGSLGWNILFEHSNQSKSTES